MPTKFRMFTLSVFGAIALGAIDVSPSFAADIVGLIIKGENNPFFVKMREGAQTKATELGLELRSLASKYDARASSDDNDSQVAAIESLIEAGAKGFAIVPADSTAIVPAIKKAREAGLLMIVLDTPLDPIDAADATYATDNFKAGELIGEWAKRTLGDKAHDAKIAFLDLSANQSTVDYLRDHGFMKGFGIEFKDLKHYCAETDPRICGHNVTGGYEEGGRDAMENLLQKCPDVNVMYTINEPAAAGGYEAIKAAGMDGRVLIVSIDGGCPGVKNVQAGIIAATSQQYPFKMASMALEAIAKFAKDGTRPQKTPGLEFYDTGGMLITDKPVKGIESISATKGLELCWG